MGLKWGGGSRCISDMYRRWTVFEAVELEKAARAVPLEHAEAGPKPHPGSALPTWAGRRPL